MLLELTASATWRHVALNATTVERQGGKTARVLAYSLLATFSHALRCASQHSSSLCRIHFDTFKVAHQHTPLYDTPSSTCASWMRHFCLFLSWFALAAETPSSGIGCREQQGTTSDCRNDSSCRVPNSTLREISAKCVYTYLYIYLYLYLYLFN